MSKMINIVIIGNGFGGTYALTNLHRTFHNHDTVRLTLIGEKNYFLFTPLLHEVATGGINPSNIVEPIRKILGCCLEKFYVGKAEEINTTNKTVKVDGDLVPYDYLVLAPGAETNFFNTKGAEENSFTLKSLEDAIEIKNHLVTQMERASHIENDIKRKRALSFVIVGGGPSGVEMAAELQELVVHTFSRYYTPTLTKDVTITLIQRDKDLLPQFGSKIRQKSIEVLRKKGIVVLTDTVVEDISAEHVVLNNGTSIETETVVWVGGVKPKKLQFDVPVNQTPDGRILVNTYLQLEQFPDIFALGDASAFTIGDKRYLPGLAQVAEKEATAVSKNITSLIHNKNLTYFNYKSSGNLVSLGQWMAAGEISHFSFYGHIAWWFWRTVYLSKMITFRKKVKVAIDWTINIFSPRDISQI